MTKRWTVTSLVLLGAFLIVSIAGLTQFVRPQPSTARTPEGTDVTLGLDAVASRDEPGISAEAFWVRFPSFAAIVQKADIFVVAEVIGTTSGRTVADYTGTDLTPYTNVQLRILDIGKGKMSVGHIVVMEQYGGLYRPSHAISDSRLPQAPLPSAAGAGVQPQPPAQIPDRDVMLELGQDPLLKVGEKVALPLIWNGQLNLYQRFAFQGRFAVDPDGHVHPFLRDDPVAAPFDGMSLTRFLAGVRSISGQ